MVDIESSIQSNLFSSSSEKTYIDKVLGRKDVDEMRKIMRKENLERHEIIDLLYLMSSTESKILNYSSWDRYVILKFFVWIRDFVRIVEQLYDYKDDLMKKEKSGIVTLSPVTRKTFDNVERLIQHNAKFLVDLYLNIGRTSLSVDAKGFSELLSNKYEVLYPNMPPMSAMQMNAQAAQQNTSQRRGFRLL